MQNFRLEFVRICMVILSGLLMSLAQPMKWYLIQYQSYLTGAIRLLSLQHIRIYQHVIVSNDQLDSAFSLYMPLIQNEEIQFKITVII